MAKVQEVIGRLNAYDPNEVVAVAIWCVEDVLERAKERGIKVSKEQAEEILDEIDRKQDASLGISWDIIDAYLDDFKKREDMRKSSP